MLPKTRRIPRKMFPLLSDGPKTFKNSLFLLRFIFLKDQPNSRFCFSVSKKISKSAVKRNRMRRIGYELLQKYLLAIRPNILAVFSFRAIPKDNQDVLKNLGLILKESKLVK